MSNAVAATNSFYSGTNPNNVGGPLQQMHGMINDLIICNSATPGSVNAATVAADLYAGGGMFNSASPVANKVAHWPITDGHGATTFADIGQNAYNATIVNPSDFQWIGGEDYIIWGGVPTASQFDAILLNVQNARPRIQARFDMDEIPESFMQSAGVYPSFDISVREVI